MSHTQKPAQGGLQDDRRRRWYHLRPEPRRRSDVMGFNSTWWMALVWLVVIVVAVYP
jgi:hypothetical protein